MASFSNANPRVPPYSRASRAQEVSRRAVRLRGELYPPRGDDYFTKIAFNNTAITAGLRKTIEGPFHETAIVHPVPALTTYRQSANAEQGAAIIGLPNLCAGFFLGKVELVGKT